MFKKICFVTSNRSEYAKIKPLLQKINTDSDFGLDIVASGSLLSKRYGSGYRDLLTDGLQISKSINCMMDDDSIIGMIKSSSLQLYEFADCFSSIKPDLGLIVGDRFDILPAAYAFSMLNIPIAHIQGGENSGTIDDIIRNVITKFAHIHFTATETAKTNVINMGEDEKHVYCVGCPSIDYIRSVNIPEDIDINMLRPYLKLDLHLEKSEDYFIVMVHPNVVDHDDVNMKNIIEALDSFPNRKIVFWPNNDPFHQEIVDATSKKEEYLKFKHLPMNLFLMILAHAKCLIGNSSTGIRESCTFGIPTIDIGKRQNGRERHINVINVPCKIESIKEGIASMLDKKFDPFSLYGDGKASEQIVKILKSYNFLSYKNIQGGRNGK
tara:strand:+ start:3214 stop:4356 length:1143 start_codon:yes stop_codon:yes gene_type:complete